MNKQRFPNETGQGAVAILVLLLVLVAALWVCIQVAGDWIGGIVESSKEDARERTRIAVEATAVAISHLSTREAIEVAKLQAQATATQAAMTTAMTYNDDTIKSEVDAAITRRWLTVLGIMVGHDSKSW